MSLLQNSGWMSGNPTLSPFSGWNEVHGGSMERNFSMKTGQNGEADRRSRVLQEALSCIIHKLLQVAPINVATPLADPSPGPAYIHRYIPILRLRAPHGRCAKP